MAEYADLNELIADYLPETRSAAELAALGRILTATTKAIDSYCDRPDQYFAPAAEEATVKYFRGQNKLYLPLPVHVGEVETVVGVEQGYTLTESNWVERSGWLYRSYTNGSPFRLWLRGVQYAVTARWGYEATPADVVEACRQWVVHLFERQQGTIGQVTPSGFVIERDMPPVVKTLLAPYVRKEFEVQ